MPLHSLREEDEEKLFSSISHLLPLRGPDKALLQSRVRLNKQEFKKPVAHTKGLPMINSEKESSSAEKEQSELKQD